MFDRRPSLTIYAEAAAGRQTRWVGPEFVICPELAVGSVEENGIATGDIGLTREFNRLRPFAAGRRALQMRRGKGAAV